MEDPNKLAQVLDRAGTDHQGRSISFEDRIPLAIDLILASNSSGSGQLPAFQQQQAFGPSGNLRKAASPLADVSNRNESQSPRFKVRYDIHNFVEDIGSFSFNYRVIVCLADFHRR